LKKSAKNEATKAIFTSYTFYFNMKCVSTQPFASHFQHEVCWVESTSPVLYKPHLRGGMPGVGSIVSVHAKKGVLEPLCVSMTCF
jgi:hypothetical protein